MVVHRLENTVSHDEFVSGTQLFTDELLRPGFACDTHRDEQTPNAESARNRLRLECLAMRNVHFSVPTQKLHLPVQTMASRLRLASGAITLTFKVHGLVTRV